MPLFRKGVVAALTAVLALAGATPAVADIVFLKSGGRIEGTVTETASGYDVKTVAGATVRVARDQVDRIEKRALPPPPKPAPKKGSGPAAPDKTPPAAEVVLGETYRDVLNGFEIRFPRSWRSGAASERVSVSYLSPAARRAGFPKIDLFLVKLNAPLEAFGANWAAAYPKAIPGYTAVASQAAKAGDRDVWELIGRFKQGSVPLEHHDVLLPLDARVVILSYKAPEKEARKTPGLIAAVAATLKALPPTDVTEEERRVFREQFNAGVEAARKGDADGALTAFQAAAEQIPEHPEVHENIASLLMKKGKADEALQELQYLLTIVPDHPDVYFSIGALEHKRGNLPQAESAWRKALELDPALVEANVNLAVLLRAKGRIDEALKLLQTAAHTDPDSASTQYNLGQLYVEKGRKTEARLAFEKALELDPAHALAKQALEDLGGAR